MARKPTKRQWRNKNARARGAAERRTRGWSTRQTAEDLYVSHQTIMRDLARWDAEHANVVQIPGPNSTRKGRNGPPEMDQQDGAVTVLAQDIARLAYVEALSAAVDGDESATWAVAHFAAFGEDLEATLTEATT